MSGFLATFQVPEQQILDQEQGPDPGLSRKALSSSGGTKKGKIIVVFFRLTSFRRVWFRPENGTFLQILGVPTGEKTRRNEENTPKRRLSEVGHESFFLRKFRFSCPFGVKKAAIPRPGNVYTRGVHGVWSVNCCLVIQKVVILYIILTQNPSNWGSKIGSKIRQFSRFLGIQLGT